jgi:FkbM family methyltransferase
MLGNTYIFLVNIYIKMKNKIIEIIQNLNSILRKIRLYFYTKNELYLHLKPNVNIEKKWYGNSYGGFYVHSTPLNSNSIVYSIGIGKDISFDCKIIKKHQCKIFAFDPTPKSIEWIKNQDLGKKMTFYPIGIDSKINGKVKFYLPKNEKAVSASSVLLENISSYNYIEVDMLTFKSLIELNKNKHIDLLKLDIEGAEYDVIRSILACKDVTINQFIVEFHDRNFNAIPLKSLEIVNEMISEGYKIFGVSLSKEEVSFIHERLL